MFTLNCTDHEINIFDEKHLDKIGNRYYSLRYPVKSIRPSGLLIRIRKGELVSILEGQETKGIPARVAENFDSTLIIVSKPVYKALWKRGIPCAVPDKLVFSGKEIIGCGCFGYMGLKISYRDCGGGKKDFMVSKYYQ